MKSSAVVNISIPEPCSQSWEEMRSDKNGRFCAHCTKTVVDYTQMSDAALLDYVQKNGLGCGRFYNDQLNRVIMPEAMASKYSGYKKWIVSLLLIAGWVKEGNSQVKAPEIINSKCKIQKVALLMLFGLQMD